MSRYVEDYTPSLKYKPTQHCYPVELVDKLTTWQSDLGSVFTPYNRNKARGWKLRMWAFMSRELTDVCLPRVRSCGISKRLFSQVTLPRILMVGLFSKTRSKLQIVFFKVCIICFLQCCQPPFAIDPCGIHNKRADWYRTMLNVVTKTISCDRGSNLGRPER